MDQSWEGKGRSARCAPRRGRRDHAPCRCVQTPTEHGQRHEAGPCMTSACHQSPIPVKPSSGRQARRAKMPTARFDSRRLHRLGAHAGRDDNKCAASSSSDASSARRSRRVPRQQPALGGRPFRPFQTRLVGARNHTETASCSRAMSTRRTISVSMRLAVRHDSACGWSRCPTPARRAATGRPRGSCRCGSVGRVETCADGEPATETAQRLRVPTAIVRSLRSTRAIATPRATAGAAART